MSQESHDEETAKYEVECVMQIFLRNFSNRPQVCKLKFKKLPGQNYILPQSVVQQRVSGTTDHYYYRFVKLRPCEAWGPIEFEVAIDNEDQDGNDIRWEFNWPELRDARMQMMAMQMDEPPQQ